MSEVGASTVGLEPKGSERAKRGAGQRRVRECSWSPGLATSSTGLMIASGEDGHGSTELRPLLPPLPSAAKDSIGSVDRFHTSRPSRGLSKAAEGSSWCKRASQRSAPSKPPSEGSKTERTSSSPSSARVHSSNACRGAVGSAHGRTRVTRRRRTVARAVGTGTSGERGGRVLLGERMP